MKCNLSTNTIQSSNTYSESNGVIHCPCYSNDCHTTFTSLNKEDTIVIAAEYKGTIQVPNDSYFKLNQSEQSESYSIEGENTIIEFTNDSKTEFDLTLKTQNMLIIVNDNGGMIQKDQQTTQENIKKDIVNTNTIQVGNEYHCQAMHYDGTTMRCIICTTNIYEGVFEENTESIPNCLENNGKRCTQCKEGYGLYDGICQECGDNCKYCLNSTVCYQCIDDYFVDNTTGQCSQRQEESTQEIIMRNNVLKCTEGTYHDGLECKNCPDNCIECQNENECIICDYEFVLNESKQCEQAHPGTIVAGNNHSLVCDSTTYNEGGECKSCKETFGELCEECNQDTCTKCSNGFINGTGHCNDVSVSGCVILEYNHTGYCMKCEKQTHFYNASESKCTALDDSCSLVLNQTTCYECNEGYVYNQTIKTCSEGQIVNCSEWRYGKKDYCLRCEDGKYFDVEKNTCLDCTNNCQTCMNSTYCFSCIDGYSITTESTCVESNQTVTGCKQLIQGTAKCALCH
ncbi:MAG: hypothetical protein IJW24_01910, partial [Clostridia bacterium]|nr:hypothetical protein [Clostridia bacterium]